MVRKQQTSHGVRPRKGANRPGQTILKAAASKAPGKPVKQKRSNRLAWAIAALLALQTGALGLKAWDEKQTADRALLSSLQREALALSERLKGQLDTARTAITIGLASRQSMRAISEAVPGLDVVVTLPDGASNPVGSRLRLAADMASTLISEGQQLGMTAEGDLVVVVADAAGGRSVFGLARADAWLPMPAGTRRYTLVGDGRVGRGDPALAAAAEAAQAERPGIEVAGSRSANACAVVVGTGLAACTTVPAPLLVRDDFIRGVIYLLLLAAPALAILSLARRVVPAEAQVPKEEKATQPADALAPVQHGPLLSQSRAGTWQWNLQSDQIEVDLAGAALLGLGRNLTISRRDMLARIHGHEHEMVAQAFMSARESKRLQATLATPSAASQTFAELRGGLLQRREGDQAEIVGGLVLDVTEAKRADLDLRRAEQRLKTAIEGFSGPFALWDQKRRLVYWNRSFELDFGLSETLRPGVTQETVWIARTAGIRRERMVEGDNATALLQLQNRRWLKLVEREIPEQGYLTVGIDVTENVQNEDLLKEQKSSLKAALLEVDQTQMKNAELARKYEEEKIRAEHASNTKGAFLANMSHELRTPLNAINGFSEMLVEEMFGPLGDARYKEYAGDILTAGRHLLDLINDILDMSKIEAGKMDVDLKPIDPVDPVDAAVRMVRPKADESRIELTLEAPDDLPHIDADHRAMRQMVLNLVSNAIKFTPEGGRVKVSMRVRGEDLLIAVTDTGIGIAEDDMKRLGTPFEQVKQGTDSPNKGTGLGLALTKSFADMHGGRMTMASKVGAGTRVTLYLPLPKADAEEVA